MEANISTRARRFVEPKDIGLCAQTLLNEWNAHLVGWSRFLDLFYKFYRQSSPIGRIMNRNLNSMTTTNLRTDFRWLGEAHGWNYEYKYGESTPAPSVASRRIIACYDSIFDQGFLLRRKIPSSPEIDAALSDYVDERASLLRRIETLFEDGYKATRAKWVLGWVKEAARERKAMEQLKTKLR
jgi:hypothetical protein